jgi:PhnB protein
MAANATRIEPYVFFNGRCQEALDFYTKALGAKVEMKMLFSESPDHGAGCGPGLDDKIMHSSFTVNGARVMASDGMSTGPAKFEGVSLGLVSQTAAETEKFFKALSEGGQVHQPLTKTFFSPAFGMVQDKFGVSWMVNTDQPM